MDEKQVELIETSALSVLAAMERITSIEHRLKILENSPARRQPSTQTGSETLEEMRARRLRGALARIVEDMDRVIERGGKRLNLDYSTYIGPEVTEALKATGKYMVTSEKTGVWAHVYLVGDTIAENEIIL